MYKSIFITAMLASGCAMLTGCGGNNSYREPQDAIDGYAVQVRFDKWNLVDIDGKDAFGGKTITSDDGEKYDGSLLSFKSSVSASVNGFYKIGNYSDGYTLLSKELDSDGKLVHLGPYRHVGMFYEDITPAVKKGESIIYIDRKGETVFDLNERTGLDVRYAYNFMGGLSVIAIVAESGISIYGAINTKGEVVLEPKYSKLKYFGSGLYYAVDGTKEYSDNMDVDILDNTGRVMFSFKEKDYVIDQSNGNYHFYFTFKDGYGVLRMRNSSDCIIVDREGKELLRTDGAKKPSKLSYYRSDEYFAFQDEDRRWGIMDIDGKIVVPAEFLSIAWLDKDKFCGMKVGGDIVVCDYKGKQLFSRDGVIAPFVGDYSYCNSQGLIEFINSKGETLKAIYPERYSGYVYDYDNTLLDPVRTDVK